MVNSGKMSKHLIEDRADRVLFIATHIGFGEEVLRVTFKNKVEILTSTGLIIVKTDNETKIITIYLATIDKIVAMYENEKNIFPPHYLINLCEKYQKKKYYKYASTEE